MKGHLLFLSSLLLAGAAFSQQDKLMFGVTGAKPGDINWTNVRLLEGSGQLNAVLLDSKTPANFVNARTARKSNPVINNGAPDPSPALAGIAALAYDAAHNRLYFAPMFREGGIRYIDLSEKSSQKVVHVFEDSYNLIDRQKDGEAKNITRMAIARNGVGYAISNDGESFIRFSTGRDAKMENLGTLIDDQSNKQVSVHNKCSAWGGDLIAAYTGELYLFTMRQQVFRINPETRVATYLGQLKGADANFSVNGAAVDAEGRVILSSAVMAGKRLLLEDMSTLEVKMVEDPEFLNATDLATSNLLYAPMGAKAQPVPPAANGERIGVYPNPVVNGRVTIVFHDMPAGRYAIDLMTTTGVAVQNKMVNVQQKGQTETMATNRMAKGLYIIRVTNASRQEAFAEKVLIQ